MWIIPKPLHTSLFAQDMQVLILDLGELSKLYARSLTWRSTSTFSRTWLRRLNKDSWMRVLCIRTLKPSLGEVTIGRWTSYQEASLVNHLAEQGGETQTETLDTYSPISTEASKNWVDPQSSSSRMWKASSRHGSKEKDGLIPQEHLFCNMCFESWKDWVIGQRQDYSQREKLAPRISAIESLSWECAPILATKDRLLFQDCLTTQDRQPVARSTRQLEEQSSTGGSHRELRWATPTARDYKGAYSRQSLEQAKHVRGSMLPDQAHCGTYSGSLNPRWVEVLMGLPIGWTMQSCAIPWTVELTKSECLGTESSQPLRSEPFESCLRDLAEKQKIPLHPEQTILFDRYWWCFQ
jgi:hypothetical protein